MQADTIRKYLADQGIPHISTIDILSSVTSTNNYLAQEKFIQKHEVMVCIAEQQTQGRGRFGHKWYSPPGVNLYMSLLWPLRGWSERYEVLGLWLLITIAELLESLKFSDVQLKWPNDICVQNKKLGGILIERKTNQTRQHVIIGIGLNIAMSKTKGLQVETPWVDLISINSNWDVSRSEFAAYIIAAFTKTLTDLETNTLVNLSSLWSRYDLLYQRQVQFTYQNKPNVGIVQGIDELGKIIIIVNGKILHLHSAYVSDIKL